MNLKKWYIYIVRYVNSSPANGVVMKVLNVAEKNDTAKNVSSFLSNGNFQRREGLSRFNKIYEFDCFVFGQNCRMIMTSVSGHLMNLEFAGNFRKWTGCNPDELFDAPVHNGCTQQYIDIKKTLEREARNTSKLIIWTDCDREGENIGFEVIETCKKVNHGLDVYRAIFSEITGPSIKRAVQNLSRPNINISNAVEVRKELDLRIGASFTRFQTLRLQKVFPILAEYLLSYGSCQFPTLGFVVERFLERERFISEPFWRIKVTHTLDNLTITFSWCRNRLFDESVCKALLVRCMEIPMATVKKVEGKPKSKWRPLPLDTTEMEKIASRVLKINAKETLNIAEKLYTQGYISYPRTETNIFPPSLNLNSIVEIQTEDSRWGGFARTVLQNGANPRQGKKSDQSHPPIYPLKYTNSLQGKEAKVYEFIVRRFLACVSKDALGHETNVLIDINGEEFTANGLKISERNYLEVYPYENWNNKQIHNYEVGQTFSPTTLEMERGETSPPNLLTEADLIALMEKHGIGTDATHAEHIETIKTRAYVGMEGIYFVPSAIGMGLVEGYNSIGFSMSKPNLRAELEADLKRISEGLRQPQDVLQEQINKYRILFHKAKEQVNKIDTAVGKYIQATATPLSAAEDPINIGYSQSDTIFPCSQCRLNMSIKTHQNKKFISCCGYPNCKNAIWFPNNVLDLKISEETCTICGPEVKKVEFIFTAGSMLPYYPNTYVGCINGCDQDFITMLGIRIRRNSNTNSSNQTAVEQRVTTHGNHLSNSQVTSNQSSFRNTSSYSEISNSSSFNRSIDTDNSVMCSCNLPAKRLTVKKPGPNTGKIFFACSKNLNERCNFFQWEDGTQESHIPQERNRNENRGRGIRNGNNSTSTYRARGSRSSRKCGICRQEGHIRRDCPRYQE